MKKITIRQKRIILAIDIINFPCIYLYFLIFKNDEILDLLFLIMNSLILKQI